MAVDLAWDGDIFLDETGDIAIVTDGDQVVSHVQARLQTYLGENYYDTTIGVPWIEAMYTPQTTYEQKSAILRQTIERTPGVRRILEFSFGVDPETRLATVAYRAETDFSEAIADEVVIG